MERRSGVNGVSDHGGLTAARSFLPPDPAGAILDRLDSIGRLLAGAGPPAGLGRLAEVEAHLLTRIDMLGRIVEQVLLDREEVDAKLALLTRRLLDLEGTLGPALAACAARLDEAVPLLAEAALDRAPGAGAAVRAAMREVREAIAGLERRTAPGAPRPEASGAVAPVPQGMPAPAHSSSLAPVPPGPLAPAPPALLTPAAPRPFAPAPPGPLAPAPTPARSQNPGSGWLPASTEPGSPLLNAPLASVAEGMAPGPVSEPASPSEADRVQGARPGAGFDGGAFETDAGAALRRLLAASVDPAA